ncbi:MAG: rhodanese-like domain-containing protein [Bacteroidia bacterium]|nr:rhodanese-like domain-containing protein [Bacteroidia bacterium]MDW8347730.1 rhodanese-like domain-containing protein [Bacteroidia bacterium]
MLKWIKKMLGLGPSTNYADLLSKGAKIIDVRTSSEFRNGHIEGSINIPLQELSKKADKFSRDVPIITCCASGIRSASAKRVLKSMGFREVYNGGSWQTLKDRIRN